jgi:hypothetical protein
MMCDAGVELLVDQARLTGQQAESLGEDGAAERIL